MEEKKDEKCCSTKSGCGCGCGKKIVALILAVLLLGAGYLLGKSSSGNYPLHQMMCPVSGAPAQR